MRLDTSPRSSSFLSSIVLIGVAELVENPAYAHEHTLNVEAAAREAVVVAVTNGCLDGSTEGFDRALGGSSVERSAEGLTPRARRSLWYLGTDLGGQLDG